MNEHRAADAQRADERRADERRAAERRAGAGRRAGDLHPADGLVDELDEAVLADLARLVGTADPVPAGLVERALFALTLENLRAEMMELRHVETPALAARGNEADEREMVRVSTITFACEPVTVMITMSESPTGGLCIDGWVAPAERYRVELYRPGDHIGVDSDEDGAFVLFDVPYGPTCLALRRADGTGPTVCTPVIEL